MDCEKFEATLMDELYGELDELTSAASKRHMAGCTRCASLLGGLKATRRVAVLPILETPPGLEAKILDAATEARKLVPLRGRVARAVSLAGSWAMKPQTAMAAVFLLMIGGGLALVSGPKVNKAGEQASMTITQEGAPAALASVAPAGQQSDPMDLAAAANAHGTLQQDRAPTVAATATAAPAELQAVAQGDLPGSPAAADDLANQPVAKSANAYGGGGAGAISDGMLGAAASASAAPRAAAATTPSATSGSDFAAAMDAYHAQNYDEATRDFDALAAAGDDNAALWAARSVRDGTGCAAAVNRFDQLAGRAYGKTPPGYDATFEAGQCYKSMGAFDAARQRFARLLTVPSYAARAQAELNKMAPSSSHAAPRPAPRAIKPAPANAQQMNNSAF